MFKSLTALIFLCASVAFAFADGDREAIAGPAYSHYHLTLEDGWRTESVGPFYYSQQIETERTWGIPPFFRHWEDPTIPATEIDIIYPLITINWYGKNYRWQLGQLFAFAGGPTQEDVGKHRFTLFPIYFQQRSPDTNLNYTAVFPFYGHLVNRLFRDDIKFVMFPFYSRTQKKDIVVTNYMYPFYDVRHGDNMYGWQIWPFYGRFTKGLTYKTNAAEEIEKIGGYDQKFILFPFYFRDHMNLGTDNPEDRLTFLPFYNRSHAPKRDSTSWGWPFGHTIVDDREKGYHESEWFWPLYVRADGSKTIRRVFPFYSHATNTAGLESHWYGWILWKKNRYKSESLDRQRTRVVYFLYSKTTEKNLQTGEKYERVDYWPFFTHHKDMDGRSYFQVLNIVEPWLPYNTIIGSEYSPVYSFWRSEDNPKTGVKTQSVLWNLYWRRVQTKPSLEDEKKKMVVAKKVSFFFGLYQHESSLQGHSTRLFYIPFGKTTKAEGGR